jgi:hypothetical protein
MFDVNRGDPVIAQIGRGDPPEDAAAAYPVAPFRNSLCAEAVFVVAIRKSDHEGCSPDGTPRGSGISTMPKAPGSETEGGKLEDSRLHEP